MERIPEIFAFRFPASPSSPPPPSVGGGGQGETEGNEASVGRGG